MKEIGIYRKGNDIHFHATSATNSQSEKILVILRHEESPEILFMFISIIS